MGFSLRITALSCSILFVASIFIFHVSTSSRKNLQLCFLLNFLLVLFLFFHLFDLCTYEFPFGENYWFGITNCRSATWRLRFARVTLGKFDQFGWFDGFAPSSGIAWYIYLLQRLLRCLKKSLYSKLTLNCQVLSSIMKTFSLFFDENSYFCPDNVFG